MKASLFITFLSFILCLSTHANTPKKLTPQTYSGLWLNSPFTTKPAVINNAPAENPFKDLHLLGIAPVEGGYRIVISHKKDQNTPKIIIEPGTPSPYEVIAVNRNPAERFGTTITLRKDSFEGIVRFEPSLVVTNNPTVNKPNNQLPPGFDPNQQKQPGQPNQITQPNQPNQPNNGQVNPSPRSRIVPPANRGSSNSDSNSQTRPSRTR